MASVYHPGDWVESIAIGRRAAFIGQIVHIQRTYCHVRDSDGKLWHRTYSEIKHVAAPQHADAFTRS